MKSEICRKWLLLCQTFVRRRQWQEGDLLDVSPKERMSEEPIRRSMKIDEEDRWRRPLATCHVYTVSLGSVIIVFCSKIVPQNQTCPCQGPSVCDFSPWVSNLSETLLLCYPNRSFQQMRRRLLGQNNSSVVRTWSFSTWWPNDQSLSVSIIEKFPRFCAESPLSWKQKSK